MKRTLHKHPDLEEYRASQAPQEEIQQQSVEKKRAGKRAVIILLCILGLCLLFTAGRPIFRHGSGFITEKIGKSYIGTDIEGVEDISEKSEIVIRRSSMLNAEIVSLSESQKLLLKETLGNTTFKKSPSWDESQEKTSCPSYYYISIKNENDNIEIEYVSYGYFKVKGQFQDQYLKLQDGELAVFLNECLDSSNSYNDTSAAESTDLEDQDSQISEKTEEEIKVEKWAEVFNNYTAKTAGKESSVWLLELQELGELMEGEEGILFGKSTDDTTEELRFATRSDDAKELDLVVMDGDSAWDISVTDIIGERVVKVMHNPDQGGETPDIVNSLVHDLFGLDPCKDIPAQMGITAEMLSEGVLDTENDSYKIYRVLDFVEYNQDLYKVSTWEYNNLNSFELDMYRRGESEPVKLDLRWKTDYGNLPYMMYIEFDEDLIYSKQS